MIKFLFMGDRHNSEVTPYSRIDDYRESCAAKDQEIIDIAKKHSVNAILHPGDFWTDSDRRIGNEYISQIAMRWMRAEIPIIGIAGNHDMIGNNVASLPNTTTGLLNALGLFKIIQDGEVCSFSDGEISVDITGKNYHKGMDRSENISDYVLPSKTADYNIHLMHGMLSPKNLGKMIKHTTIDAIKHTAADITLCGHDHIGFGIIRYNDRYFINPGAVVRMSCDEREMNRKISVILISIDKLKGIQIEQIYLNSAKPGEEVLSREHILEKEDKLAYDQFVKDGVEKLHLRGGVSITDVLEDIYNRDNIPKNVQKSITSQITERTASLQQKAINPPIGTEIVHIKIHNFQSHADSEFDLHNNFNVILGESHQGKSAILRAIRWVAENKPSGKGLIRIGESEASVELTLQNGTIIRRFISAKENGYKVYKPDGTEADGNTHMVSEIQTLLGWNNMPIGEGDSISLNHLKQGDSWYLIGNGYTSSDRARILGAINNTDGADAAIKDFDKENSRINDAIKHEQVEEANLISEIKQATDQRDQLLRVRELISKALLTEKISNYFALKSEDQGKADNLQQLNRAFDEHRVLDRLQKTKNLLSTMEKIERLLNVWATETTRLQTIDSHISSLNVVDDLSNRLISMVKYLDRYGSIFRFAFMRESDNAVVVENSKIINSLALVENASCNALRQCVLRYKAICDNVQLYQKANNAVAVTKAYIDQSSGIDLFPSHVNKISCMMDRYNHIRQQLCRRADAKKVLDQAAQTVKTADDGYERAVHKKTDILLEMQVCPTCFSQIDSSTIQTIISKSN